MTKKNLIRRVVLPVLTTLIAAFIYAPLDYHFGVKAEVEGSRQSKQEEAKARASGEEPATPPLGLTGTSTTTIRPDRSKLPDFLSLLEKPRTEVTEKVRPYFGEPEVYRHRQGGVELCFKDSGIHFVFDRADRLNKVSFYADAADPGVRGDHHNGFGQDLPLGLHFEQDRQQAGTQIENKVGRDVEDLLGTGEWAEFYLDNYRVNLRFGARAGKQILREMHLLRLRDEWAHR